MERTVLMAVAEPMLINPSRQETPAMSMIAYIGIADFDPTNVDRL